MSARDINELYTRLRQSLFVFTVRSTDFSREKFNITKRTVNILVESSAHVRGLLKCKWEAWYYLDIHFKRAKWCCYPFHSIAEFPCIIHQTAHHLSVCSGFMCILRGWNIKCSSSYFWPSRFCHFQLCWWADTLGIICDGQEFCRQMPEMCQLLKRPWWMVKSN